MASTDKDNRNGAPRWQRRMSRLVCHGGALMLVVAGVASLPASARGSDNTTLSLEPDPLASTPATPGQTDQLAGMSLEDLMNIEVTSVSRYKQKVSEAPAAISVITQEDIAASGLHSIPELLRLSPGLSVARIDS